MYLAFSETIKNYNTNLQYNYFKFLDKSIDVLIDESIFCVVLVPKLVTCGQLDGVSLYFVVPSTVSL